MASLLVGGAVADRSTSLPPLKLYLAVVLPEPLANEISKLLLASKWFAD